MKVKAKQPFYRDGKLYRKGDVLEVSTLGFDVQLMDVVPEEQKEKQAKKEKKK